jgi:hypothetical protein
MLTPATVARYRRSVDFLIADRHLFQPSTKPSRSSRAIIW